METATTTTDKAPTKKKGWWGTLNRAFRSQVRPSSTATNGNGSEETVMKKPIESVWKKLFAKQQLVGPVNNNVKNETEQEKEIREGREELKRFIDEFKSQTSLNVDADKLTNAIHNFQFYEAKLFESNGYNDGIKGVKDINIESTAQAKAEFIFEHTGSILAGRLEGVNTELKFIEAKIEGIDAKIAEEKDFNDDINFINKKEHRHFSKPIAAFYVIVGIAMMFADFPISLSISKYFIDLPIDFVDTFWNNVTTPEILLFSLGITFLSVYYKILYDEYVNVSILTDKTRNQRINTNTTQINIAQAIRFIVKIGILGFFIYVLYNIGSVRNALNPLSIDPTYPAYAPVEKVFGYRLISFVGLTILLPLLSGICLSVGLNIYSNINNLKFSNKKINLLEEEKKSIEAERTVKEVLKNMLLSLKKEWDNREHKINGVKLLFTNSYYQGFKRGHRTKIGNDIYDIAHSLYVDHLN